MLHFAVFSIFRMVCLVSQRNFHFQGFRYHCGYFLGISEIGLFIFFEGQRCLRIATIPIFAHFQQFQDCLSGYTGFSFCFFFSKFIEKEMDLMQKN